MNTIDLTGFHNYLPQIQEACDACSELVKGEDNHKKIKKRLSAWSYKKREELDKGFIYLGVLNSGPAGETLASRPLKKQADAYNDFFEHTTLFIDFMEEHIEFKCSYFNANLKISIMLYHEIMTITPLKK